MYRTYHFTIVLMDGSNRTYSVRAHDDLEAFKSLCRVGWYQELGFDDVLKVVMMSAPSPATA